MAPAPEPSDAAAPDAPPPARRPLWRRLLKGALLSLAGLLLLVALAIGFLHTGPGKSLVRGLVEDALAERFNGTVTLGAIDYALFGDVTLDDLEIVDPAGRTALDLEHLTLSLDWGSLMGGPPVIDRLAIDGVTVDAAVLRPLQKQPTQPPNALTLRELDVNNVDVTLTGPDGSVTRLTDLRLHGALAFDLLARTADVSLDAFGADVALTRPDGTAVTFPFATGLVVRQRGDEVTLATRAIASTIHVARPDAPPLDVPLTVGALDVHADPSSARLTFAGLGAGPLAIAQITASLHLGPDRLPTGEQQLAITGLTLTAADVNTLLGQTLLLSDLRADLSVVGPLSALVTKGAVQTAGGTLTLTGTVDASDLAVVRYDLRLEGADLDTGHLIASSEPPLRTSFALTLRGAGLRPGATHADLHLALGPTEVGGQSIDALTFDATARGDRLSVDALSVTALGQTFTVEGHLDQSTRHFAARLRTTTAIATAITRARDAGLVLVPLPALSGALDVDLVAEGTLKAPLPAEAAPPPPAAAAAAATAPPLDLFLLERLPVDTLTLKGHAKGQDLAVDLPDGPVRLGAFAAVVDFALAAGKPTGTLTASLDGLVAPRTTLDEGRLVVTVDGLDQRFELTAKDAAQRLDAHAVLSSRVDLETRSADATLERLDLTRGAFTTHLVAPIVVHVAPPDPAGEQAFTIPPLRLALAGGTLSLAGTARFARDPNHPGATQLTYARGDLDLADLSLVQLAALAGKSTRGASGTLSGHLTVDGTPSDPAASFALSVRGRAKGAAPALFTAEGSVRDARLTAELRLVSAERRELLFDARLRAPLALAPGRPPGLAPGGALSVDLALPQRRLGALAELLPGGLPAGVDPDATVAAHATLRGTPARPTGDFGLDVAGRLVPPGALEISDAPARQRLAVEGKLVQLGAGQTRLEARLQSWLDADAPPLVDVLLGGVFGRSPLVPNPLARPWTFDVTLSPIDLARLPLAPAVSGTLSGSLALSGAGADVFGHGGLAALRLQTGTAPAADLSADFALTPTETTLDVQLGAGGLDVMALTGRVGLGGTGLRRTLATRAGRARLLAAPLALTLTVPKRALSAWSALAPKPLALPGDLGGVVIVSGTLGAPEVAGELAWDGFSTLAGTPGRVALVLAADARRVAAGLEVGPRDGAGVAPVRFSAALPRAALTGAAPVDLDLTLEARATDVDLLSLVPDAFVAGRRLDVTGRLDWRLDALLHARRDATGFALDPTKSRLDGELTLRDVHAGIPGSERSIDDGLIRITTAMDKLGLSLRVREKDLQRDDRAASVEGELTLTDLRPVRATLTVTTNRFLITGTGPGWGLDNPEGELDLGLTVTATKLLEPVKDLDVLIERVDLYAPDRFVRLHHPQYTSWGDVVYLDETGLPSGKLPARPAPTKPAPADPSSGFDVHLRIPEPLHVVRDPLTLTLQGGLEIALRGDVATLNGRIDARDGAINVMGWSWPLIEGAITAHGGPETALARFAFARRPHAAAQRDAALEGRDHDGQVFITVTVDQAHGQRVDFGGVGGAYLLDAATVLNTGRTVRWSRADLPASENVQFGQVDQGLVNTFVQTNIRNLIFMDRANGWSDPVDDHAEYGRIWHFEAERYVNGDAQRLRLISRPPAIGQNHLELQYDLLFAAEPRSVAGVGARLGTDLRLGLGLFWEFWSRD